MSVPVVPGAVPEPLPLPDHILEDHTYPQRPSLTANSETSHASSELSFLQQPFPSLTDQSQSLDSSPALPPSRNTRNLVIDSSAVLPPVRSIRRKPLSSTASASPIAARYSSGEYLTIAKGLPRPEQRFSRSFSVDSPTVYDFPHPAEAVIRPALDSPNDIILIQGIQE